MRPILLAVMLALAAVGAASTARAADPPTFGAAAPVAPGALVGVGTAADGSLAAMASDGQTTPGRTRLLVAQRPAALNAWSTPEVVADEPTDRLWSAFGRDALGSEAAAWTAPETADGPPVVQLRVRDAAASTFGPQEAVSLPDQPPLPGRESIVGDHLVEALAVGVAADGAVALAVCDAAERADRERMMLWLRPAGTDAGQWQDLGRCVGTLRMGTDALGGVDVLWSGPTDDAPEDGPRVVWVAHRAAGADGFAPRIALSDPTHDADNGSASPDLSVSPTGTAEALWNGLPPGYSGPPLASEVLEARRGANGVWSPPTTLSTSGFRPSLTTNAFGGVAVVWNEHDAVGGSLAAAGRPFAPPFAFAVAPTQQEARPIGLDVLGDVVVVSRTPDYGLSAMLRTVDGEVSAPVAILPPGVVSNDARVQTDPFGNGVVVTTAIRDRVDGVLAVPYSAAPPQVTHLDLSPAAVGLATDEPARVAVQVLAGARSAKLTATLTPRRLTRLGLSARMSRLLRAPSARLVVRTRDAGPRSTTLRLDSRALRHRLRAGAAVVH